MQPAWQPVRFRVLGPLQTLGDDRVSIPLGGPKQRLLLAGLLLRRGRFVPRAELIDALWGQAPPESAVASLHVYVHGVRKALGAERIETRGVAYRLRLEGGELDLERFEHHVEQGRRHLAAGEHDPAASVLRAALELWQGRALGDLPSDALVAERAQLEELRVDALELLAEAELESGREEAAIGRLAALVPEHPFRERLRELQILALYRAGRQKEALEAYREARRALVEELGIEPGPRLRALEEAVLRQESALGLDPASVPTPVSRAPAPPSRAATPDGHPGAINLPAPPTRLIGREREVAEILALLREHAARLVTLTGPGGTGKTRLAIAVAEQLGAELSDGARFVDLSAISEPALLLPTVAAQLGVQAGATSLADAVAEHLRPLSMLLVVDNLERLVPAATALADLLTAARGVVMLVTSRIRLHLRAEHEYPVPPLSPPPAGAPYRAVSENDGVRLLAERARAVDRALSLTEHTAPAFAHICRRLDGLPLALELAASRMRILSPDAVAAGLDHALELLVEGPRDLPARQQTLRATLDWSHELLGTPERRLFACLATFAGSFDVQAVEAVAGAGARGPLAVLAEANLVRRLEPERYAVLETIREYAAACLDRSGERDAVGASHCRYYLAFAEQVHESILRGHEPESGYRRLEREHDNLRAALDWASRSGELELEVRLACALRQFWIVQGYLDEGRSVFDRLAAATEGAGATLRARALMHGGPFLYRQGHLARARAWWEEAMALLSEAGDTVGAARCAGELGGVAFSEGDLAGSQALYEQSADGFRKLGDHLRLAIVTANLAEVLALRGDMPTALRYAEQAVAIDRELGDPDGLAVALHTLARVRHKAGDAPLARQAFAECLTRARAINYREMIANCVEAAAELSQAAGGDPETAAWLLVAARTTLEAMGVRLQGLEGESFTRTAAALSATLGNERLGLIEPDPGEAALDLAADAALALLDAPTPWIAHGPLRAR